MDWRWEMAFFIYAHAQLLAGCIGSAMVRCCLCIKQIHAKQAISRRAAMGYSY